MVTCVFRLQLFTLIGCLLVSWPLVAQENPDSLSIKNGISKPNTLATHPFGILLYTLPHNFKFRPDTSASLDLQLSSGNIWGQPVTTYIPSSAEDRADTSIIAFYDRIYAFDPETDPAQSYQFEYDGVLKDFRIGLTLPLGVKSDINITARSFFLTRGKPPFTLITSDRFIEFIHSNLAGGEDPFARKRFEPDQARIAYLDRNGNRLDISNGEFVLSGIEAAYYYYPTFLLKHKIRLNLGLHLGANLSKYNTSMDAGFSVAGVKGYAVGQKSDFMVGLGLNLLRKRFLEFRDHHTDLGTSSYFGSFEGHLEFTRTNKNGGHHSIGINCRLQTPYNKKKEEDYYVPYNPERLGRWHDASRHLYKFPSYWSLIYSFTRTTEFSIYIQQDQRVNNAPDFQTGIRLRIPVSL